MPNKPALELRLYSGDWLCNISFTPKADGSFQLAPPGSMAMSGLLSALAAGRAAGAPATFALTVSAKEAEVCAAAAAAADEAQRPPALYIGVRDERLDSDKVRLADRY